MAVIDSANVIGILTHYLRAPATVNVDPEGVITTTFTPPLTAPEQTAYDGLARLLQSPGLLDPALFDTVKADLSVMRTFRQQTAADFGALTQAQRDRALFDVVNAQTNVLRALLKR